MTDKIDTVQHDENGSSEIRGEPPLSSTINPPSQPGGGFSIWGVQIRLEELFRLRSSARPHLRSGKAFWNV